MKKSIILLFSFSGLLPACDKDEPLDLTGPEITVFSPTNGQMTDAGDSVLLDIGITDVDMHEFEVRVVNAADTSIHYFEEDADTHDDDIRYIRKFQVPAVSGHTDVILFVHAEDHEGNETDKNVNFAFMP